jgi:hypothetical protein
MFSILKETKQKYKKILFYFSWVVNSVTIDILFFLLEQYILVLDYLSVLFQDFVLCVI